MHGLKPRSDLPPGRFGILFPPETLQLLAPWVGARATSCGLWRLLCRCQVGLTQGPQAGGHGKVTRKTFEGEQPAGCALPLQTLEKEAPQGRAMPRGRTVGREQAPPLSTAASSEHLLADRGCRELPGRPESLSAMPRKWKSARSPFRSGDSQRLSPGRLGCMSTPGVLAGAVRASQWPVLLKQTHSALGMGPVLAPSEWPMEGRLAWAVQFVRLSKHNSSV